MQDKKSNSVSFGERLRMAREIRGWSQSDLATRAKMQPTAISHFETGNRSPSFDNLRRLSDALNVTTDFLLGRSENPGVAGSQVSVLFRNVEKMTDEDLSTMNMMAKALLAKQKPVDPRSDNNDHDS